MNLLLINLIINLWANATLSSDSHALKIDFTIHKKIEIIEIGFIHKSIEYKVARVNCPNVKTIWRDSFIWYSKNKWAGGNLKITAINKLGKQVFLIPETDIRVKDFGMQKPAKERYLKLSHVQSKNYGDPYAWRMFGYDPQNTGHYPFSLQPPLEFKWRSYWSNWGYGSATMISGCAAYGKLFIGDGSNYIQAVDIETGQVIWSREITSNTWTCAFCPGESILFVGCSIGFGNDTTFYALDPYTGATKWGKALTTVEYSPIVVDSIVYVGDLGLPEQIYAFTLKGRLLWYHSAYRSHSPTYWQEKVYHTSSDWGRVLNCRNALNGDSLWIFIGPSSVKDRTIYDAKVYFFSCDTLFALNTQNGELVIKKPWYQQQWGVRAFNEKIFIATGRYGTCDTILTSVHCLCAESCSVIWEKIQRPRRPNGGRTSYSISSENGIIWVTNLDFLYLFDKDTGALIQRIELPITNTWEPSFFLPITYKNYFIGGHRDFVYVYKADTFGGIEDTSLPTNLISDFKFYSYFNSDGIIFYLYIPFDDNASIKLYNIQGDLIDNIYNGPLVNGRHIFHFNPGKLSSGLYFGMLEISNFKKVIKIPFTK